MREPTRDLIVIVLLRGELVAMDLRGNIVRRLTKLVIGEKQREAGTMIMSVAAWRNRVTVVTRLSGGFFQCLTTIDFDCGFFSHDSLAPNCAFVGALRAFCGTEPSRAEFAK